MHSNQYGQVIREEQEVLDLLLENPELDISLINFSNTDAVNKFNASAKACGLDLQIHTTDIINIPIEEFDRNNQLEWFMPKDYCPDLFEFLLNQCDTEEKRQRVEQELELYIKHGMIDLLHYMKYLVDIFRKNQIVWGVGRGSSVASYVLYLIGIHKIDSLKYNLDIHEFLK